jgi:ABC-type transport system involved in cytochrome c biogenesis permease subunit
MPLVWLRVAVFLYGVAALAVLPAALYDRPRWRHLAVPATVLALLFHFVSLAEMLSAAHHSLPIETHETLSFIGLLLAFSFLAVYWRYRTMALGVFLLPIAFLLVLIPAFRPGLETVALPGPHSGWLVLHIGLLLAGYAALFVSLVANVLYLVQERRLKSKFKAQALVRGGPRLPPLETIDSIAQRALLFGLPCMTGGLLIGSFMAELAYGPAYFTDPKILLAFAMWLAYVAMIHVRRLSGLRGRRAVYLSSFVFVVILAVWASNQVSAVHRFTAP